MKRLFCFYCQEYKSSYKLLKWWFCPKCRHLIKDDGTDFYRVCDKCGSNMPTTAEYCLKCGHNLNGGEDKNLQQDCLYKNNLKNSLFLAILLVSSILIFFCLLYLSFYFVFFGAVLAVAFILINYLTQFIKRLF